MLNKVLYTTYFLLLFALFSQAQKIPPGNQKSELNRVIDSIFNSHIDSDKIPGAVILVKKDGKIIIRKAYGYALKYDYDHNLVEKPEKMSVRHMFDIASLTKVIGTTTSIMLLADRGLVKVDDPVARYVESFNKLEKSKITIRHLLTHSSGINEWYPMYYRVSDKEECFRLIGDLPLKYKIGEQRKYSDLGFTILGEIIEIVSGKPLDQFMNQNIFQPLGMNNTTYNPLKQGDYRKIAATSPGNPYERRMVYDSTLGYTVKGLDPDSWSSWRNYLLRGETNDGNAWYANGGISGAAGLFSTAEDLQKLVDMLMNMGKTAKGQFLSEETVRTFLTKDSFNNGIGWMMDPANSFMKNAPEGTFGHTGFTGTSITVIPDERISIILLINRQNSGLMENGDYYNVNSLRLQIFIAVMKHLNEISH
jgi:CubicO group peptidase (beta-lactamase class C family)